jgi:hypothetical protein
MLQYRTEMLGAEIPMPEASASMRMPSYDDDDMDNEDLEDWLGGRSVTFAELEALADMQPGDDLNILCELTVSQEVYSPGDTEEITASTYQEGMERN